MKTLVLGCILFLGFSATPLMAQNKTMNHQSMDKKENTEEMQVTDPVGEKIKITEDEIPARSRADIVENYYNGEIVEAYKFVKNGKITGYMITVWNKPNKWTIRYDADGSPINKVTPEKI